MSYRALNWAWEAELPMAQKFVLVALADMADERETCYPGQERLASMTGMSVSTVRRAVKTLEESGAITRQARGIAGGGRTSDRYYLNTNQPICTVRGNRSSMTPKPVNDDTETGHSDRGTPREPSVEPPGVARKRASRIPEPFLLTSEMRAWAADEAPGIDLDAHTREFVDYWRAKSGRDATKADWAATWRNWIRKAHRWQPGGKQTFAQQRQNNSLSIVESYRQEEVNRAEIGSRNVAGLQALN